LPVEFADFKGDVAMHDEVLLQPVEIESLPHLGDGSVEQRLCPFHAAGKATVPMQLLRGLSLQLGIPAACPIYHASSSSAATASKQCRLSDATHVGNNVPRAHGWVPRGLSLTPTQKPQPPRLMLKQHTGNLGP
jgi:hypothetical protein